MPNLYCTIADSDFTSYDILQGVIAICELRLVKEKEIDEHIIIHISFFTEQDKEAFHQKIKERLPSVIWRDRL